MRGPAVGAKGDNLRQFAIPARFSDPSSPNPEKQRYTRIFAALVTPYTTFAVCDFARLIRLQITSRERFWTLEDLSVGSEVSLPILSRISVYS